MKNSFLKLEVMDQVDNIYRTTEFSSYGGVTGLGFEIGKVNCNELSKKNDNEKQDLYSLLFSISCHWQKRGRVCFSESLKSGL